MIDGSLTRHAAAQHLLWFYPHTAKNMVLL